MPEGRGAPRNQPQGAPPWRPRTNPWLIAVIVTMAAFMEILDTTIVNVSLPHIAGSLSTSYDDATWTLTSYLVANGIVLPISGALGRLIGRKRYFILCIAAFTAASFLCGIATSLPELILFRLLQGFFGGGLQPNQQSIILDTFEPAQRGRAFSVVAIAVVFAPIIGPTLGGWITDTYSWRWIFFLNLPVGIVAVLAVASLVEDPPWVKQDRQSWHDLDYTGIGLIALGLGFLQVTLDRGEDLDWFGSHFIRITATLCALGIVSAIVWLLFFADKPVVNLRVFCDRNFAIGSFVAVVIFAILYSSAVLIPQLAQTQLGYTAMLAGLILSPGGVVVLLLIPLVSRVLLPHVQTRFIIAFGFFSLGVALAAGTDLVPNLSFWDLAILRMLQTFGLAFLFVPNTTVAYATLPREQNADASSLYVMLRNIAGSVGISFATSMLTERTQVHRAYITRWLTPLNAPYEQLLHQYQQTLHGLGYAPAQAKQLAAGLINHVASTQAAILAYIDIFTWTSAAAFLMVPVALMYRGTKASGGGGGAH
jgi:DHA2 family multidrug resistance protein